MKHHGMRAVFLVCVLIGAHGTSSRAQHVPAPVQPIAQYMRPAPGSDGNFRLFADMEDTWSPSISGDNVAFGAIIDGGSGIYAYIDGQLVVVADSSMKIPGTEFFNFAFGLSLGGGPGISGRTVAFSGHSLGYGSAIWLWRDGMLTKVVDTHTLVPGRSVTFGSFLGAVVIDGENIAFNSRYNDGAGIYAVINGELRTIAETGTFLPGAAFPIVGFGNATSPAISGENVAFFAVRNGLPSVEGLYLSVNGEIRVIAETGMPMPGGGTFLGNFGMSTSSRRPGISGENVVFSNPAGGLFAYINGTLRLIANDDTPSPGGNTFSSTYSNRVSIDGENIAFGGSAPESGWGIFSYINGEFRVIADRNTPTPGFATNFLDYNIVEGAGPEISGERVVFSGRPEGVYVGDGLPPPPPIPTVSTWGAIAMTLLLLTAGTIAVTRQQTAA